MIKHRKYKLLSNSDNFSWVLDIENDKQFRCFYLDLEIGSEFYLYEKDINIYTGTKKFQFSIINIYEKDCEYVFEIYEEREKALIISNHIGLTFAIPLSFKEYEDQKFITLKIKDLDLDNNKPQFYSKDKIDNNTFIDEINDIKNNYEDFIEGETYKLIIKDSYTNKNNKKFIIATYNNNDYYIHIPPNIQNENLGNTVDCYLGYYNNNSLPNLKLTRSFISQLIYKEKQKYTFILKHKEINNETAILRWTLENSGYLHYFYPTSDPLMTDELLKLNEGDNIDLFVRKISDKGYLSLTINYINRENKKYLIEEIFEEIGYSNLEDEYFFNPLKGQINQDNEKTEITYIDQYNEGENLWVFSYLAYLDEEIFNTLELGNYEKCIGIINLYIKLEHWILEGSDYLRNFSDYTTPEIIKKAEYKIEVLSSMLKAIDIYLKGEEQTFIDEVKAILKRSPYLNKERQLVLKEIVKLSNYFSGDTDIHLHEALIILLKHKFISDDEKRIYSIIFEIKLSRLKNEFSKINEANELSETEFKFVISSQYILIHLNRYENNELKQCLASVLLLRYLSIYYNDNKYIDLAINLIINKGVINPNLILNTDIFTISLVDLQKMISYPLDFSLKYVNSGCIYFMDGYIEIHPKNLNTFKYDCDQIKLIDKVSNFNIYISSSNILPPVSNEDKEEEVVEKLLRYLETKQTSKELQFNFNQSKIYKGIVKSNDDNPTYRFLNAQIEDENHDVLLHLSNFHKAKVFETHRGIIKHNDVIQFEILDLKDGRFSISTLSLIEEYAKSQLSTLKYSIAKVVKIDENRIYLISKEGYPIVIYNHTYELGDVLKVRIINYNNNYQCFLVDSIELSNEIIIEKPEFLFRNYLIACGVIVNQDDSNSTKRIRNGYFNIKQDDNLKIISYQLIKCLEQRLTFINDIKELSISYFTLANLGAIIKSNISYYYNNKLIKLAEILKIKNPDSFKNYSIPNKVTLKGTNKSDEKDDITIELFKYLDTDVLDIPIRIDEASNLFLLKKLIESYNLFYKIDKNAKILEYLKQCVVQELYNSNIKNNSNGYNNLKSILENTTFWDNEELEINKFKNITNLGSESKTKEFKSSFFHSASNENQSNVIMRTIAGFLNAYDTEGYLYIGVNDSGDIIGLKNDLEFSPEIRNLDQYQNHIQSIIAASFPSEINSLLDFRPLKSGHLDYLEIKIPKYNKPVAFENEFYQRQGVQTRKLKGNDIVDFITRKTGISINEYNESKLNFDPDKNSTIKSGKVKNTLIGEIEEFDFYSERKLNGKKQEIIKIYDSNVILGYLNIFSDKTYTVTASDTTLNNTMFKIPITEEFKYGSLLLCYDNACINRVEVRSILNKPFNKVYMNAFSEYGNLIFVTLAHSTDDVAIRVKRFEDEYIKVYEVKKISEHKIIGLKGNCIIQEDFDQVISYYHTKKISSKYDSFRRDSRQGLGEKINKNISLFRKFTEYMESN